MESDISIPLFLAGTGVTLLATGITQAGWRHRLLVSGLFVAGGTLVSAGICWHWLRDYFSPSAISIITEIASNSVAWFVVIMFALGVALFRRPKTSASSRSHLPAATESTATINTRGSIDISPSIRSEARELRGERYKPRAPDEIIELIDARADPRQGGPNIVYRRKLRVSLRNASGSQIKVKAADWISSNGYVPFQPPFYSVLQEEDAAAGGYLADKWKDDEKSELIIAPNTVFRASVGLDQSFSVEEIGTRRALRGVGMLTIPLIINDQEMEWRTRL